MITTKRIDSVVIMENVVFHWNTERNSLSLVGMYNEGWNIGVREGYNLMFDEETIKHLEERGEIRLLKIKESYTLLQTLTEIAGGIKGRTMSFVTVERESYSELAVVSFIWDDEVPSLIKLKQSNIREVPLRVFDHLLTRGVIA